MPSATTLAATVAIGRGGVWAGRIITAILVILLLLDATMKLIVLQPVIDASLALGWPVDPLTVRSLGAILAMATFLYAAPQTSVLGAIVLTGYLGGAIATHARIGDPLLSHTLFGVYVGVALWAGLWLRDPRLRALIPFKMPTKG